MLFPPGLPLLPAVPSTCPGVPGWPGPPSLPAWFTPPPPVPPMGDTDLGCALWEDMVQGNAAAYAQAHNIPAMNTEFGNTSYAPPITGALNENNSLQYGWLFWQYNPNLVTEPGDPAANVNTDVLNALQQAYPQVISGTPGGWSVADGVLQFSYSTEMASGTGSFAAGSQTTIWVPSDDYTVAVTGGTVVSPAGAHELVIASDGSAPTVSVTVTPTS